MSVTADPPWTENRPTRGFRGLGVGEIWQYRELVAFLAGRDLKLRYKQTAFGVAWALVQPLAGVAVLALVFNRFADVPSDGLPYVVFALAGYAAWGFFSTGLQRATASLVENASLVTKVWFPRMVAPIAAVLPGLVDLAVSLSCLALLVAVTGARWTPALVLAPVAVAWLVLATLGVGLWLAALNVQYRDARHITGVALQLWLFASPVAYPTSLVPPAWRWAYHLNPMAGVIELVRWTCAGGAAPGAPALLSLAVTVVVLVTGAAYLRQAERRFADVI